MSFAAESHESLPILYSDTELCVVNKPSGLAVHPGWAPEKDTALSRLAKLSGRYVYPVHRLDRATSGALVFAFSAQSARAMQLQIQGKEFIATPQVEASVQGESGEPPAAHAGMEKLYLALVRGITPECGVIDHALAKSKEHEKREARSAFQRLGIFERYSLVRVRPFTGRLHQIRRHMKFICHPLIGDTNYGRGEHNRSFRERFAFNRLALHAAQLRFLHPLTAEPIVVSAPLPSELEQLFTQLGLISEAQAGIDTAWPSDSAGWRVLSDLTRVAKATGATSSTV